MAGPASGTDSPRMTRMPVPSVAPTLIMVSCSTPKLRTSRVPPCPVSASLTSCPIGLRRRSWAASPGRPAAAGGRSPIRVGTVIVDVLIFSSGRFPLTNPRRVSHLSRLCKMTCSLQS